MHIQLPIILVWTWYKIDYFRNCSYSELSLSLSPAGLHLIVSGSGAEQWRPQHNEGQKQVVLLLQINPNLLPLLVGVVDRCYTRTDRQAEECFIAAVPVPPTGPAQWDMLLLTSAGSMATNATGRWWGSEPQSHIILSWSWAAAQLLEVTVQWRSFQAFQWLPDDDLWRPHYQSLICWITTIINVHIQCQNFEVSVCLVTTIN